MARSVTHEFQHLAPALVDRRHDAVVILVHQSGRRFFRQLRGEAGEVAHIGEENGGADAQDFAAPHIAGENAQVRLIADIHAHDLAHDAPEREDLLKRGKRRHDRAEHGDILAGESVRRARAKVKPLRMPFGRATGTAMWCV
jgi:hypothetical protein